MNVKSDLLLALASTALIVAPLPFVAFFQTNYSDTAFEPDKFAAFGGKFMAHLRRNGLPDHAAFTFIHHLSPHPPYAFRADCTRREEYKTDFKTWDEQAKPLYLDNLHCVNKRLEELTTLLAAADPSAVIVIQGDHGTAFQASEDSYWRRAFKEWGAIQLKERSSILNLLKLPERCQQCLTPNIDNVNSIRLVLACVAGEEPGPLDIWSYWGTYFRDGPDGRRVIRIAAPN